MFEFFDNKDQLRTFLSQYVNGRDQLARAEVLLAEGEYCEETESVCIFLSEGGVYAPRVLITEEEGRFSLQEMSFIHGIRNFWAPIRVNLVQKIMEEGIKGKEKNVPGESNFSCFIMGTDLSGEGYNFEYADVMGQKGFRGDRYGLAIARARINDPLPVPFLGNEYEFRIASADPEDVRLYIAIPPEIQQEEARARMKTYQELFKNPQFLRKKFASSL